MLKNLLVNHKSGILGGLAIALLLVAAILFARMGAFGSALQNMTGDLTRWRRAVPIEKRMIPEPDPSKTIKMDREDREDREMVETPTPENLKLDREEVETPVLDREKKATPLPESPKTIPEPDGGMVEMPEAPVAK